MAPGVVSFGGQGDCPDNPKHGKESECPLQSAPVWAHNVDYPEGLLSPATRELAEANITNSGKTVLGHFPGYIDKAKARGDSFFDIGKAWDSLTDAERWAANSHFLDKIVERGDQVLLSLPKSQIREGSYLAKEVEYLISKGYRWINQWSLGK